MRIMLSAAAALVLAVSPSFAGGDWDDRYDDWRGDRRHGYDVGHDDRYYDGPAYAYYPAYAPRAYPYYAPRVYLVPPPPRAYYGAYYYGADCEIKRKWRRGRLIEKIDCDD